MPCHQSQSATRRIVVIQDFIAIAERLRTLQHGCHWNIGELADARDGVLHLDGFIRQLVLVAQVLQVTATTTIVQWTGGRNTPRRMLGFSPDSRQSHPVVKPLCYTRRPHPPALSVAKTPPDH